MQNKLYEKVKNASDLKKIPIIYIGSRPDVDSKNNQRLFDSGSLFDGAFIKKLKDEANAIIVVCCLEYKYFKTSLQTLPRVMAQTMHHLLHADYIQFMNAHDKSNFEKTLDELSINGGYLLPHKALMEKFYSDDYDKSRYHFSIEEVGDLKGKKTSFISGIYTIPPLYDEIISSYKGSLTKEEKIAILANRPNKVLCFGIIRPRK